MENASKALLIAASVLIGVVIMSLAIYLFTSFSGSVGEINKKIETDQLQQFNSQFTSYEGKDGLTIYDVLSVTNLAKENNNKYDLKSSDEYNYYITVKLDTSELQKMNEKGLEDKLKNYLNQINDNNKKELDTFTCKVTINQYTGRVNLVVFTAKKNIS